MLYRAVAGGRLQAVKLGGRGDLRFKVEWVDEWLSAESTFGQRER
jgi:hypothetical protein